MSKSFLKSFALLLSIVGSQAFAASIYSFSGQIDGVNDASGQSPTYLADQGIFEGAPIAVRILLDAARPGYFSPNGADETPAWMKVSTPGITTEIWTRYAELLETSISLLASGNGGNYYQNTINTSDFPSNSNNAASIATGAVTISKRTGYDDPGAFVENWQVGDTLSLFLNIPGYSTYAAGTLTLTAISEPLPSIVPPSAVPLPGAGVLFMSCLAGMAGLRKVRAAQAAS